MSLSLHLILSASHLLLLNKMMKYRKHAKYLKEEIPIMESEEVVDSIKEATILKQKQVALFNHELPVSVPTAIYIGYNRYRRRILITTPMNSIYTAIYTGLYYQSNINSIMKKISFLTDDDDVTNLKNISLTLYLNPELIVELILGNCEFMQYFKYIYIIPNSLDECKTSNIGKIFGAYSTPIRCPSNPVIEKIIKEERAWRRRRVLALSVYV